MKNTYPKVPIVGSGAKYISTKNGKSHYLCEKHRNVVGGAERVFVIEIAAPELSCGVCTEEAIKRSRQ